MNRLISKSFTLLALALGLTTAAKAATPVAVWDGDFTTATKGAYTLNANGNTVADDGSKITIDSSYGVVISATDATMGHDCSTTIIKFTGCENPTSNAQALFAYRGPDASAYYHGLAAQANGNGQAIWNASLWNNGKITNGSLALNASQTHTLTVAWRRSSGTGSDTDQGTKIYLDGTMIANWSGLFGTYDPTTAVIGGLVIGKSIDNIGPATGMQIQKVAIFNSKLSAAEIANYVWPSDVIDVKAPTTVAAINTLAAGKATICLNVSDGVTIDYGNDTFEANQVEIVSSGNVTLTATTQPAAAELAKLDLGAVSGKVTRSWLTPGIVGMNFNANGGRNAKPSAVNAANTDGALASGGTWYSDPYNTSGTTAISADGLTKLSWSCNNVYTTSGTLSNGTFMQGYLDDGGNGVSITVTGIPYDTYDVIVYCATDNSDKSFKAKTVNGVNYKWDAATKSVISDGVTATDTWGSAKVAVGAAVYGSNAIRINGLTGKLTITGGSNGNGARGCIAAIQIMPTGEGKAYALDLAEGANVVWSQAAWTGGDGYPTEHSATITLAGDATITVDKALDIPVLTLTGTGVLTFVDGDGTLGVGNVMTAGPTLALSAVTLKGDIQPAVALTANATITVPAGSEASVSGVISGGYKLTKAGAGTLTVKAANTFTGGLEVDAGVMKTTNATGLGPYTNDAPLESLSKITVKNGATLDLANSNNMCYDVTIAGSGMEGQGALVNGGNAIGTGERQTTRLTLTDDATVGGTGDFGMLATGYGRTTLALNGHALTKVGANTFWLKNTEVTGSGTINVQNGSVWLSNNGSSHVTATGSTFNLGADGTLIVEDAAPIGVATTGSGTVNVKATALTTPISFGEGVALKITLANTTQTTAEVPFTGTQPTCTVCESDGTTVCTAATTVVEDGKFKVSVEVGPASLTYANPVTNGVTHTFTYAFRGLVDANWATKGNWYPLAGANRWGDACALNKAPMLSGGDSGYLPTVIDGDLIADSARKTITLADADGTLEGWNTQLALFHGVDVTVGTIVKVQGNAPMFVWVDETSSVTFNKWGSNGQNGTLGLYVANAEGVTFKQDRSSENTFSYYLKGSGSVKFESALAHGTHAVRQATIEIGSNTKPKAVITKKLVTFPSTTKQFSFASAAVLSDTAGITPVATEEADVTAAMDLGTYVLMQTATGVVIRYVGYGDGENADTAKVGETIYTSLAAAVEAVPANGTLVLLRDCADALALNKAVTLDLNGHAMSGAVTLGDDGVLSFSGTGSFTGSLSGSGTVVYDGAGAATFPSVDASVKGEDWTGTVWLKNYGTGGTVVVNMDPNDFGNANSTVRFSGVKGYFKATTEKTMLSTLDLVDAGYDYALDINNGSSNNANVYTFPRVTGDGKIVGDGGSTAGFRIQDGSGFTGTIYNDNKTFTFGTTIRSNDKKIWVDQGAVATIGEGKSWTASNGGIFVNGTVGGAGTLVSNVTFGDGAAVDVRGGTLTAQGTVTLGATLEVRVASALSVGTPVKVLAKEGTSEETLATAVTVYVGESAEAAAGTYELAYGTDGLYVRVVSVTYTAMLEDDTPYSELALTPSGTPTAYDTLVVTNTGANALTFDTAVAVGSFKVVGAADTTLTLAKTADVSIGSWNLAEAAGLVAFAFDPGVALAGPQVRYDIDCGTRGVNAVMGGDGTYEFKSVVLDGMKGGTTVRVKDGDTVTLKNGTTATVNTSQAFDVQGGTLYIGESWNGAIWFGNGTTSSISGGEVVVRADGQAQTSSANGFIVSFSAASTINISGGVLNVTNSSVNFWTDRGTINMTGGTLKTKGVFKGGGSGRGVFNLGAGATVELGSLGWKANTADLTLRGGTLKAMETTEIANDIVVESDSTISAEPGATIRLTGAASGAGVLIFDASVSKVEFGAKRAIASKVKFLSSATEVSFVENIADDGVVPAFDYAEESERPTVRVFGTDGVEKTVTEGRYEPTVSGKVAWFDFTFTNTLQSVGENTASLTRDTTSGLASTVSAYTQSGDAIFTAIDGYMAPTYPTEWSASVYAKVPDVPDAVLMAFGTKDGGSIALITGDTNKNEIVLARTTGDTKYDVLARMTVPNAYTAKHLYSFCKSERQISIYLDSTLWSVYNSATAITFGGGFQLGSLHGGTGNTGFVRYGRSNYDATDEENNSTIGALRMYKTVLGPNAIRALADEFKYISPNGSYSRTLTSAPQAWWVADGAWEKDGTELVVAAPAADSTVTLTGVGETTVKVNLASDTTYEALTLNGASDKALTVTTSGLAGYTGRIKASGQVAIFSPVMLDYAAIDIAGVPLTLGENGMIYFDLSSIDLSKYYVTTYIPLTGVASADYAVGKIATKLPTAVPGRTRAPVYDEATQTYGLQVTVEGPLTAEVSGNARFSSLVWKMGETTVEPDWTLAPSATLAVTTPASLDFDMGFPRSLAFTVTDDLKLVKSTADAVNATFTFANGKSAIIEVAENETMTALPFTITGGIIKTGAGTLAIANGNSGRTYTVDAGTLKFTQIDGGSTPTIIVNASGIFDMNGKPHPSYGILLNGGWLVNNGDELGVSTRQFASITLTADSYIGGAAGFCMVSDGYNANTINLGGYTLTKEGANTFTLCNTTVQNGQLVVREGTLKVNSNNQKTKASAVDSLTVNADASLEIVATDTLTVGTLNCAGTLTNEGTLKITNRIAYSPLLANVTLADGATVYFPAGTTRAIKNLELTCEDAITIDADEGARFEGTFVFPKENVTFTDAFKAAIKKSGYVKRETATEVTYLKPTVLILR